MKFMAQNIAYILTAKFGHFSPVSLALMVYCNVNPISTAFSSVTHRILHKNNKFIKKN